jgi:hypothetical protein
VLQRSTLLRAPFKRKLLCRKVSQKPMSDSRPPPPTALDVSAQVATSRQIFATSEVESVSPLKELCLRTFRINPSVFLGRAVGIPFRVREVLRSDIVSQAGCPNVRSLWFSLVPSDELGAGASCQGFGMLQNMPTYCPMLPNKSAWPHSASELRP